VSTQVLIQENKNQPSVISLLSGCQGTDYHFNLFKLNQPNIELKESIPDNQGMETKNVLFYEERHVVDFIEEILML
jgi:hypothetical protein